MNHLFAYGTLMCADIMENVTGQVFSAEKGILRNYQRYLVKNETYPALISEKNGHVEGVVYLRMTEPAWERLDIFEGEMYKKQIVNVMVYNSKTIKAMTYVLRPEFKHYITSIIWDYGTFLKSGKMSFQKDYNGFKRI